MLSEEAVIDRVTSQIPLEVLQQAAADEHEQLIVKHSGGTLSRGQERFVVASMASLPVLWTLFIVTHIPWFSLMTSLAMLMLMVVMMGTVFEHSGLTKRRLTRRRYNRAAAELTPAQPQIAIETTLDDNNVLHTVACYHGKRTIVEQQSVDFNRDDTLAIVARYRARDERLNQQFASDSPAVLSASQSTRQYLQDSQLRQRELAQTILGDQPERSLLTSSEHG